MIDIYKKAVDHFGCNAQLDMAVEECAELIQAIQKYKRGCTLPVLNNIHEEIADVEIMLSQLRIIFNTDAIDKAKEHKLKRLNAKIEAAKERL